MMCRYTIAIATMGDGSMGESRMVKSLVLRFQFSSSICLQSQNQFETHDIFAPATDQWSTALSPDCLPLNSRHHVIPRPTPPQTATAASMAALAYCIMHLDFQQTEHKFCFASSAFYSNKDIIISQAQRRKLSVTVSGATAFPRRLACTSCLP
jgi:hypothetical protein